MTLILGVAAISFFTLLIAALGQEWRYYRSRRDIAMDRQAVFHNANVATGRSWKAPRPWCTF
jgi:hypothetical protein